MSKRPRPPSKQKGMVFMAIFLLLTLIPLLIILYENIYRTDAIYLQRAANLCALSGAGLLNNPHERPNSCLAAQSTLALSYPNLQAEMQCQRIGTGKTLQVTLLDSYGQIATAVATNVPCPPTQPCAHQSYAILVS